MTSTTTVVASCLDGAAGDADYIWRLRATDAPSPTATERLVWLMETRPSVGVAFVRSSATVGRVQLLGRGALAEFLASADVPPVAFVRREAWADFADAGRRVHEETACRELALRVARQGWRVALVTGDYLSGTVAADGTPGEASAAAAGFRVRHPLLTLRARVAVARRRFRAAVVRHVPGARWVAGRITAKLEADGLTPSERASLGVGGTLARLVPHRFKGRRWRALGLPVRVDRWDAPPGPEAAPSVRLPAPTGPPARDGRTRVLVFHPYLIAGGAETLVLNLFTHIDPAAIDLHLITTEDPPDGTHASPWLPRFAEHTGSIYQLPAFLEPASYVRFMIEFIRSREIDVILMSLSIPGYHALPAIRAACPDVRIVDVLHAEAPYAPMDHIRLAARYREWIDLRVVTTETVKRIQIERYGETAGRLVVIPNGIDTAEGFAPDRVTRGAFRRRLGVGPDTPLVLFFGRLVDEKQPMHIVEVATRMAERSEAVFAVVGAGPQSAVVEEQVRLRGLRNVVTCGPEEDVAGLLADATVTLFPSKREGLPMSGIESLSMGVPVVASRVEGWTDLVTDGVDGLLVPDGDFDGYVAAIERLLGDSVLRARMSAAARQTAVERYDVRDCAARWTRLLVAQRAATRS